MDYYKRRWHNMSLKDYDELNEVYLNVFPPKKYVQPNGKIVIVGGEIETPEQLAMADAIRQAQSLTQKGTKNVLDRELANQRAINKIYISQNAKGEKEGEVIDLRGYKKVGGGYDISDLMRGVKVTGLPNGISLLAESVIYNPTDKTVTYTEYTDGKGATPKTVSLTKFKQDIRTLNPQIDMKFLNGLDNPITAEGGGQKISVSNPANTNKSNNKWNKYRSNK